MNGQKGLLKRFLGNLRRAETSLIESKEALSKGGPKRAPENPKYQL